MDNNCHIPVLVQPFYYVEENVGLHLRPYMSYSIQTDLFCITNGLYCYLELLEI